jgi:N-ethylmaleimide reductase
MSGQLHLHPAAAAGEVGYVPGSAAGEARRLLSPVRLGTLCLRNRVVMAPLTRQRSLQPGNRPHALNALYYQQRASAGMIIAEGAHISPEGQGFAWTPGIHDRAQAEGWRLVTEAVHARGGTLVLQLWHVGRISHRRLQPAAAAPLAPSAVRPDARCFVPGARDGVGEMVACDTPRGLDQSEIILLVEQFASAARLARDAGFDGVEIQAGNGFLLDQFLCARANQRRDGYGGSTPARLRIVIEVLDAVIAAIGDAGRVGIHLSPLGSMNDTAHHDPQHLFTSLVAAIDARRPAYLHLSGAHAEAVALIRQLRHDYSGAVIRAGGYDAVSAERDLAAGDIDAAVFGKPFISNPDLVERIETGAAWAIADDSSFYGGGADGYTTYPTLAETTAQTRERSADHVARP